jgi:hypothetical protein
MKIVKMVGSLLSLSAFAFLLSCSAEDSSNDILATNEKELLAKKNVEQELTEQEVGLLVRLQRPSNRIDREEAFQVAKEFATIFHKSDSINSFNEKDFLLAPSKRNNFKRKAVLSKEVLSASSINVKNVSAFLSKDILKNSNIRTNSSISIPDTLAYVFDFNGGEGYAIISADARISQPMLGFVKKGSFDRQTDNPGMAFYLEMLDSYLINSITEAERQEDSLLSSIHGKLGSNNLDIEGIGNIVSPQYKSYDEYYNWDCPPGAVLCLEWMGPIIPVKWGQQWPFNDSIPPAPYTCSVVNNINGAHNPGGRNLTGCVATATAQVMAYWQHPSVNTLTGMNVSWAALSNLETKHDFYAPAGAPFRAPIAKIFKTIGTNLNLVDNDYGCNGTYALSQDAIDYLKAVGYFRLHAFIGWSYRAIKTALNLSIPVPIYIRGCKLVGGQNCHAWLIDGDYSVYRPGIPAADLQYLFHNWGWNGDSNGIFPVDIINQTLSFDYRFDVKISPIYGP